MARVNFFDKVREQRDPRIERPGGPAAKPGEAGHEVRLVPKEKKDGYEDGAAKKAATLDHAALGHSLRSAGGLGVPALFLSQHGALVVPHTRMLEQLRGRLDGAPPAQRAAARDLPGTVLQGLSPGLSKLQDHQRAPVLADALAAVSRIAADPRRLSDTHVDALRSVAQSAGKLQTAGLGASFERAANQLLEVDQPDVLRAVHGALSAHADRLSGAWTGDAAARGFTVATAAALRGARAPGEVGKAIDAAAAEAGLELKAEQRQLLEAVGADAGARSAQARAQTAQLAPQLAAEHARLAATPALQPLLASAEQRLAPEARLAWYQSMSRLGAQPPEIWAGAGALTMDLLAFHGTAELPPQNLDPIAQHYVQLAATGLTSEQLRPLARQLALSANIADISGALAQTAGLLQGLRQAGKGPPDRASIAELGQSLVGNAQVLAPANGPHALVVQALNAAPSDVTRAYAAREAVPGALAVAKAEAGQAHDIEHASFGADIAALAAAQVSLRALRATYPSIPADALPHLTALGLKRGIALDVWMPDLAKAFKLLGKNKEAARGLRTLLFLADQAGADPAQLLKALLHIKGSPKKLGNAMQRTVTAVLHENNFQVSAQQVGNVIASLERGEDLAEQIETRMQTAMAQKLGLNNLLAGGQVRATDHGMSLIAGELKDFFAKGANAPQVPQPLLKEMLVAVLEDRFQDLRFHTASAARQLEGLDEVQRRDWMAPQTMNHVRFDAQGQKAFDDRVSRAGRIGKELLGHFTAAWGPLDALEKRYDAGVESMRKGNKNDKDRMATITQLASDARKLEAMRWVSELASLTPANTTPLQYVKLADARMERARPVLGDEAYHALQRTLKIEDIPFSEVRTSDGTNLDTLYRLGSANCLKGWPNDPILLPYAVDANKRMIVTKNQDGQERRAILRLVDRQDPGHEGQQMLVLERTYPDNASEEEKQRVVEHALRRGVEMGIPVAYPLEYYWDSSKTQRRLIDMNRVIEDLNRRYRTTSKEAVIKVKNRAGNLLQEYIDSAPLNGAAGAGVVGVRRYPANQDTVYENKFMILTPRKD